MTDSDEQLVDQWRKCGDPTALSELALRYLPQFYRTARSMLLSHAHAEDVAQEVMLKVVRALPTFRSKPGFRVWSYTILLNAIRTELKKAKRWRQAGDMSELCLFEVSQMSLPDRNAIRQESRVQFEAALSKLTEAQRTALVLMHIEGVPANEVAFLEGCSVDSVYQRVAEAKRKLRNDPSLRSYWLELH